MEAPCSNFTISCGRGIAKRSPWVPLQFANNDILGYFDPYQQEKEDPKELVGSLSFYPVFEHGKERPTYESQEEVSLLVDKSNLNLSGFNYNELSGALYTQLAKYTQSGQVSIAHRFHNRNTLGNNKKNLFAWLASDAPITIDGNQSPLDLIQDFKAKKRRVHGEALASRLCNAKVDLSDYCPVRFNYIPIILNKGFDAIQFPNYTSTLSFDPRNKMDYMLDLIVRENEEQLEFIIRYSKLEFGKDFVEGFVKEWIDLLPCFNKKEYQKSDSIAA